jgi:hypothetical protein
MKNQELLEYVQKNVNVYFRPMLDDIVKEWPVDVCVFMVNWMRVKGYEIYAENHKDAGQAVSRKIS